MPTTMMRWLAQASSSSGGGAPPADHTVDIMTWCTVFIIAVVVLFFIASVMKKRSQEWQQDTPAMKLTFTLDDVRQMLAAGQLTEAEAARMREKIIARSREGLGDDKADAKADDASVEDEATDVATEVADAAPAGPAETTAPPPSRDSGRPASINWLLRNKSRRAPGPARPARRRRP
ncbi:MAG: hypothetical protein GC159_04370 [Phycisphaera sp.]|nr:hypothetical protein [Phycisphaera sp.]